MKKLAILGSCLGLALLADTASAGIQTWDPVQGAWGSYNTWTGAALNGNWEDAAWSTSQTGQATPGTFVEGNAVLFAVGGGATTSGNPSTTLTFTVNVANNHTCAGFFDGALNPNSCIVTFTGAGVLTMQPGNLNAVDTYNSSDSSLGTLTFNTVLAGDPTAGICMELDGTTYFNAVNTYQGGTYLGINIPAVANDPFFAPGILNFNSSSSFGTGAIYLLDCQGGSLAQEYGVSGVTVTNSVINYDAVVASQAITLIGTNAPNGPPTFSGPWIMSGGGGGTGANTYTSTATLATYGPVTIGSGGVAGNIVNISGVISGTNVLNAAGVGTLQLSAANTFSGTLNILQGTVALTGSGSISSVSSLSIGTNSAGGGTLDVSALASPYVLASPSFSANGDGGDNGNPGTAAQIIAASGGTFDLGTAAINLTWTGYNGNLSSDCLWISQGALKINGNAITVNNGSATALTPGTYSLIRVLDGLSGTITGTLPGSVTVTGNGIAPGCNASLAFGSLYPSDINLVVTASSTTVTIAPCAAVAHGTAPTITVTVSPDPTGASGGPGTVQFKNGGVNYGSPVAVAPGGTATSSDPALASLAPGTYTITGVYSGATGYAGGTTPALTLKATTAVTESVVYWDNNGLSAASSGTWDSSSPDWALSSALSSFTYAFPSGADAVVTTTGNVLTTFTVNSAINIGGVNNNAAAGGTNVFSGTGSLNLNAGTNSFNEASGTCQDTYMVPITGTGLLEHDGSSVMYLFNTNSYSGGTFLSAISDIRFNNSYAFGTGPIIFSAPATVNVLGVYTNDSAGNVIPFAGSTNPLNITNTVMMPPGGSGEMVFVDNNVNAGACSTPVMFSGPWIQTPSTSITDYIGVQPSTANVTISGTISGQGILRTAHRSAGDGSLYLWGNNTWTGGTVLGTGSGVNFNNANSFGTGDITWVSSTTVLATPTTDGNGNATGASAPFTITNKVNPLLGNNTQIFVGNTAAPVTFSGPWTLGGSTSQANTFQNQPAGTSVTISGAISGTTGFKSSGTGSLTITGPNTFSGPLSTATSGHVLTIGGAGSLGGGTFAANVTTASGTTFNWNSSATQAINGAWSGSGSTVNINGPGVLTLGGSADNSGLGVTINSGGTLVLNKTSASNVHALGATTTVNSGGLLKLSGANGDQIYSGVNVTVNSGGVFDAAGKSEGMTSMTLAGTGSGSGALINSTASTTSVITTTAASGFPLSANATIGGAGNVTMTGIITGAHALTYAGSGVLKLTSANTYSLGTTISSGTVEVNGSIAGNVTDNSILQIDNNTALAAGATLTLPASPAAGAGVLNNPGADTISALYFGGVQKAAGTWGGTGSGAAHINAAFTGGGQLNITTGPASSTALALTSGSNPSLSGAPLTFTATVTGNSPSGTVQFQVDGVNSGAPVALSGGTAAFNTSSLTVGTHSITAIYSGDDNNNPSTSSPVSQTVNSAAPPTITITSESVDPTGTTYSMTWTSGNGFQYHVIHGNAGTPKSTWTTVAGTTVTATGTSTSVSFSIVGMGANQAFAVVSP